MAKTEAVIHGSRAVGEICEELLGALTSVVPQSDVLVPLHEPCFEGNEWNYLKDCLDSGWVSSVGSYVDRFETMLAEACGVKHAICVVNGTAALEVSLRLAGVERDDEVLIPALTFVATANALAHRGAIPHLVDSERATLGMDPKALGAYLGDVAELTSQGCINRVTGRRIGAIVPMHTFGHAVEMDALLDLAKRWKLPVVEDAAEGLGSRYKGRPLGSMGLLSALSFNGNKIITTGGGGAILTNDRDLARQAKHLTTTAKVAHAWAFYHDQVAYNYRLPNLNAALGCAQLEKLPEFLEKKRSLAQAYKQAFEGLSGYEFFEGPASSEGNYWLNAILLDCSLAHHRDEILSFLNARDLMVRPVWALMQELPMYKDVPRMGLSCAEDLAARLINIPSSPQLINGDHIRKQK